MLGSSAGVNGIIKDIVHKLKDSSLSRGILC